MEDTEEENHEYANLENNFVLRNYQTTMVEIAKSQNSIIFLPTGSGKTLIAIQVLCSLADDIKGSFSNGAKRVFFINTTKVMVYQVGRVLRTHTKFKIGCYTGDMNLDSWTRSKWMAEFEKYHVFVLTAEILRQILELKFISLNQIRFLIFDECHHAASNHPYKAIMDNFSNIEPSEAPLVLGLSAVLLKTVSKACQVRQNIQNLEKTFRAKVITHEDSLEILRFSANPIQKIVIYNDEYVPAFHDGVVAIYDNAINMIDSVYLKPLDSPEIPDGGMNFKDRNKARKIKNCFVLAKESLHSLGGFCGSLAALFYTILFEKFSLLSVDKSEVLLLMYARTEMSKARHLLLKTLSEDESVSTIYKFSSPKVQKLIDIVRENPRSSILIFVHQRPQAIILSYMFKRLAANEGDFSVVKADFIIGTSVFSSDSIFNVMNNEDIVKGFACGDLNLLIATNILEEGVDVSACDTVISFDFPLGYPSYFQSKGRARHRDSTYYLFVGKSDVNKNGKKLQDFQEIYTEIQKIITGEETDDDGINSSGDPIEKIGIMRKSGYIEINAVTAIKIVYRYTQMLPQDKFSYLAPLVWYKRIGTDQKQAFLQLPMSSRIRQVVEGDPKPSIISSKRSVFLKTAKLLYEAGELNEDFNCLKYETKTADYDFLFPHYKKEKIDKDLPQPGTKKRFQVYDTKFPEYLSNCLPRPGVLTYLHVISFKVAFDKPSIKHKVAVYDLLRASSTYAIISTKKIPKICEFPLYLTIGQVDCELLENYDELYLTESELDDIKVFHFALFKKVLKISKNAQIFDNRNKELSFFVVPVEVNDNMKYKLNWDLIRCDYCKNTDSAIVRYNPSSKHGLKRKYSEGNDINSGLTDSTTTSSSLQRYNEPDPMIDDLEVNGEKPRFTFTETDYKYFVFIPSYRRMDPPQYYVLWKLCPDLTPLSPFPNSQFDSYCSYYKAKYDLEITNPHQPLLKVSPVFRCANFNHPEHSKRKTRDRFKEHEEHFIPEFCDVIPFLNKYWIKANLLPTVLHRIVQVYNAEEFRRYVVGDSGLGSVSLPENSSWKKLEPEECSFEKEDDDQCLNLSNFESSLPLSQLKRKTWNSNVKPVVDPDRLIYKVGIVDLEYFVKKFLSFGMEEITKDYILLENNDEVINLISRKDTEVPFLKIFGRRRNDLGPDLTEIIRASTAKSANDLLNYERLEILGDSFLKFGVSLYLFKFCEENEGVLTFLKGKLVGNRNLLYCGLAKNFQNVINVTDFEPLSDWNPPLLYIPERLSKCMVSANADPAVIYQFEIPPDEQFSGDLSEDTFQKNEDIVRNYEKGSETSRSPLLPYKAIKDKVVSDCVEAFIGVYLREFGLPGAFNFLTWMDILPKMENFYSKLMEVQYRTDDFDPAERQKVISLLSKVFYTDLEDTLGYTFKNKTLLLEALTHPSFVGNRITVCYQRLEFLGDAVLDFLITTYLYENFETLTPGQVTDIRSALVNNVTFGCLAVRYELHKYMLLFSSTLSKVIENFVSFQLSRNHLVDENVLVLLEEKDCLIAESVQVPKALGDVFESLAGAIFLDSGNSLETVWKVYYKMMKKEIDAFTKTVPKNSIRLLTEICKDKPYYEVKVTEDFVKVSCTIYYNDYEIQTHGCGHNKKEAKLSAAKLALKKIMEMKTAQ